MPFGSAWTVSLGNLDPDYLTVGDFRIAIAPALGRLASDKVFLRYPGQWASDAFRVTSTEENIYYNVHRWYQLQAGRYSQPDPLQVAANIPFAGVTSGERWSLYSYVDANPLCFVDPLGLLKFVGCSDAQKRQLTQGHKEYCPKIESPEFTTCCAKPSLGPDLKRLCSDPNLVVRCEPRQEGLCDGCGWSLPFVRIVHFCPHGSKSTCGPVGCTLLHEMTHIAGHPFEKWPEKVEECLGCNKK